MMPQQPAQCTPSHALSGPPRPTCLTSQFLRVLHQAPTAHTGYFQIVQFHQKHGQYYSTHISDGYFKCKVIFRDGAARQIDRGQIKLYSVLYGTVCNQGGRVMMVARELACWHFHRLVGIIRSWKFQTPNLYLTGNNYIDWPDQLTENTHNSIFNQYPNTASIIQAASSKESLKLKEVQEKVPVFSSGGFSFGDGFGDTARGGSGSVQDTIQATQSINRSISQSRSALQTNKSKQLIQPNTSLPKAIKTNPSTNSSISPNKNLIKKKLLLESSDEQQNSSNNDMSNNMSQSKNKSKSKDKNSQQQAVRRQQRNKKKILELIQQQENQVYFKNWKGSDKKQSIMQKDRYDINAGKVQQNQQQINMKSILQYLQKTKLQSQSQPDPDPHTSFTHQKYPQKNPTSHCQNPQQQQQPYLRKQSPLQKLKQKKLQDLFCDSVADTRSEFREERSRRKTLRELLECQGGVQVGGEVERGVATSKKRGVSLFQLLYGDSDEKSVKQPNQQHISKQQSIDSNIPMKTPFKSIQKPQPPKSPNNANPSHPSTTTTTTNTAYEQALKSQSKVKSQYPPGKEVKIQQLNLNRNKKYAQQDRLCWVAVRVLAMRVLTDAGSKGGCGSVVVVMEQVQRHGGGGGGKVFNMLLGGVEQLQPFQEGAQYQLSLNGISIYQPATQQISIDIQLHADSSQLICRQYPKQQLQPRRSSISSNSPHPSYTPLQKIATCRENISINIVGLVTGVKNIANKKKGVGWVNIITICDPFTGYDAEFAVFGKDKIVALVGGPVVLFNVIVREYQGKKGLNMGRYTVYFFDQQEVYTRFIHLIPQIQKIHQWQQQGHSIRSIPPKPASYLKLPSLIHIQSLQCSPTQPTGPMLAQTPICRITKISPNVHKILCDMCNKKMYNLNACFSCGKRTDPRKELRLSVQISDGSYSLWVEFDHYGSAELVGVDGEGFADWKRDALHRRIVAVLRINGKYSPSVVRLDQPDMAELARQDLQALKDMVKFI